MVISPHSFWFGQRPVGPTLAAPVPTPVPKAVILLLPPERNEEPSPLSTAPVTAAIAMRSLIRLLCFLFVLSVFMEQRESKGVAVERDNVDMMIENLLTKSQRLSWIDF
ncbi:hypothetical protein DY000_02057597 [Brassica cretica]|uniref:Transmembrane protein n=1 Tax=Brassica cretica TaxID=69181 RepID=A0ABQ7A8A4_BRACR|nr:hypothetical protein DY000_02057597 [Brassica cretica]